MGALAIDLKFALRMLRKSPGVTAAAILALALGIGANTAIFSVVDGVLLRPLPYPDSARLVLINGAYPSMGRPRTAMSYLEYQDVRAQSRTLADVAAYDHVDMNLSGTSGAPERVTVGVAAATLFGTLGVQPFLGRSFSAEEEHAGSDQVAIIDYATWRDRFAGDERAVGRTLVLDNLPYRIVGVLPRGFRFAGSSIWIPLSTSDPSTKERGSHWLKVIGRMRPGVTRAQLDSELGAISERIREINPTIYGGGWHVFAEPLLERIVGNSRPALLVLLGAVAFVLLIACANVANLMLARAASRRREMAVRTALGAKPSRLVRQLLTESLVLSLVGGALGVLLAVWGIDALLALAPDALPRAGDVALDGRVLLYSLGLAILTGIAFGLAPAISATRLNLDEGLRDGARGASAARGRLKRALVVGELALSLMLLVGTGLMVRSFLALRAVDPGLSPEHVLTMRTGLPTPKGAPSPEDRARWVAWFARATARLSQLPGVRYAAVSDILPFEDGESRYTFEIEGDAPKSSVDLPHEEVREVSPGFFEALGIPLVRGRLLGDGDRDGAPSVAVINQALARRYWPHGEDPVGKRIKLHHDKHRDWTTIVGVVGDMRDYGLDQPVRAELYMPYAQLPEYSGMAMIVRSDGDAAALAGAARAALGEVDAAQPIYDVQPLSELLRASLAQRRFALVLMLVFAAVALLLAAVGIYGVMSYTVAQRTQEIGIRVALGASARSVLGLVVGDGMRLVAAGLLLGVAGALALTRLIASLLYAISPTDAITFSLVALLLVVVALVATIIPARRAMRVDPMQALRSE